MRLEKEIIEWADAKDLIKNGNPYAQYAKFMEEANEILVAINKNILWEKDYIYKKENNIEITRDFFNKGAEFENELKDAYGDTLVTLIISAEQFELGLEDCLEYAYNEIKDRTGKTVGGTFIKD